MCSLKSKCYKLRLKWALPRAVTLAVLVVMLAEECGTIGISVT